MKLLQEKLFHATAGHVTMLHYLTCITQKLLHEPCDLMTTVMDCISGILLMT